MATGIGNRKVLTPRSSNNPRRSLPPQAKLVEAASFESFEEQPSSPDIMTTKLMEKVRNNGKAKSSNAGKNGGKAAATTSSFNQRLNAAASNSLTSNSGRSKLSTEEFNLDDERDDENDVSEKYKNKISSNRKDYKDYNKDYNKEYSKDYSKSNSYNSSNSAKMNEYGSSSDKKSSTYNSSSNQRSYNDYNTSSSSYTSSKSNSYNNYTPTMPKAPPVVSSMPVNPHSHTATINAMRTPIVYSKPPNYPDSGSTSFDRWSTSGISSIPTLPIVSNGESVELLQEQVNHLRKEYEGLKQRFSELSRLRLSEPEEILEQHKKLSELRDQAAEKTIKALQKENEQLKKQLLKQSEERERETEAATKSVDNNTENQEDDENFMMEIEKILKIYSSFSGLKITPTPSNPLTEWHCEFSSRSGKFDFQLIYETELNRYQYIPIENDNDDVEGEGRVKNLPSFLASDILITADQMQIFFWRLLDTLSKRT